MEGVGGAAPERLQDVQPPLPPRKRPASAQLNPNTGKSQQSLHLPLPLPPPPPPPDHQHSAQALREGSDGGSTGTTSSPPTANELVSNEEDPTLPRPSPSRLTGSLDSRGPRHDVKF